MRKLENSPGKGQADTTVGILPPVSVAGHPHQQWSVLALCLCCLKNKSVGRLKYIFMLVRMQPSVLHARPKAIHYHIFRPFTSNSCFKNWSGWWNS